MGGHRLLATLGWVVATVALAAAVASALAAALGEVRELTVFLGTAGIAGFCAAALIFGYGGRGTREGGGLAIVGLSWVVAPAFAALPFAALTEAGGIGGYFEAVSAFTTTGTTGLEAIDDLPRSIVLWRALLEWLGGGMTVVFALSLIDRGGRASGGVRLMAPGAASQARLLAAARRVVPLYASATILCLAALRIAGLPGFDAWCLAMTTLATGGAMPRDGTLASYGVGQIHLVVGVFLALGATGYLVPGALRAFGRRSRAGRADAALVGAFIACAVLLIAVAAAFRLPADWQGGGPALVLEALFAAISLMSTSGLVHDAAFVGALPLALIVTLLLIGGAQASTAGGLKIGRVTRMLAETRIELEGLIHPSSIAAAPRTELEIEPIRILWSYLIVYLLFAALLSGLLAGGGFDFDAALLGGVGAVTNTGANLAFHAGMADAAAAYAGLAPGIKLAVAAGMVLGRIEILAALAVLTPVFWRR